MISKEEKDKLVTGFYVPSKYDSNSVPKPTNTKMEITKYDHNLYGVIRFNGSWTENNFLNKRVL